MAKHSNSSRCRRLAFSEGSLHVLQCPRSLLTWKSRVLGVCWRSCGTCKGDPIQLLSPLALLRRGTTKTASALGRPRASSLSPCVPRSHARVCPSRRLSGCPSVLSTASRRRRSPCAMLGERRVAEQAPFPFCRIFGYLPGLLANPSCY